MTKSSKYNLVAENTHLPAGEAGSTVVAEYVPNAKKIAHYQSEAELERAFIKQLETQAYEYLNITSENELVLNLREQLEKIIENENLDRDATYKFIKNAFRDGSVPTTGTEIAGVLPPISKFRPDGARTKKRESVLNKLTSFFERFFDISAKQL